MKENVKNHVEALLFSSGKAMEEQQLAELLQSDVKSVKAALKLLEKEYAERESGLRIFNEGTLWKMIVGEEHVSMVRKIVADTELSRATMETLAVIAYNYPSVLQSKVIEVRGGSAYEQIEELQRLGFVSKNKEGRSFTLKLTEKFYEYFDVEGGKDIKKIFKDIKAPEPKEKQQSLEVVPMLPELPKGEHMGNLEVFQAPAKVDPAEEVARKVDEEKFFGSMDEKLEHVRKRNDALDQDELFKRQEPIVPSENANSETNTLSDEEETGKED